MIALNVGTLIMAIKGSALTVAIVNVIVIAAVLITGIMLLLRKAREATEARGEKNSKDTSERQRDGKTGSHTKDS